ncbi:TonB-dependent siderophore receptor [Sphingomonas rubra]|uniref:Outer-membrane receptor for ferric coprogen and ferric-rhodotorulic acid n=1 Tax=Sphingomonas rubra TaxID=634430 RepID=A0A1I5PI48_9SPHN|nr:TonB-dependent siderophore receptor [Sphingomonas rubra]SFP33798.1 outer-membrane receptor for ferric coprogen and ferric-rhodotorulic acid [Sphingomonas rubra]
MTAFIALIAAAAAAGSPTATASPEVEPQQGGEIVVTGQRTEGSDDYTIKGQTTATRIPLTLRETPQSVSVVTRQQIQDFQLNDVNQLLTTVPGINVQANETDRVYYSARGFDIQTFQIDGIGVPFAFGIQTGSIDTAIYDHIEVVRGAPGLLSPTGNPSAVINFVRKRPTGDLQVQANAQYGSFDALRLDGDVSVPLTSDGKIRARAVGVYSDSDSYLDRYGLRRWTGYGIVEADLGPNTTLSGGYGHQDHKSRGAMWGAIPLVYTDGTRIDFARSTNVAPDWSSWNVVDRQIFGDLTHQLGNDWVARVSGIRRATDERNELFYVYGNPVRGAPNGIAPDPLNPGQFLGIRSYPGKFRAETRNLTLEAYVTGPVSLFGRRHEVMLGVNRSAQDYQQRSSYDNSTIGLLLPFPALFEGNFPEPTFPTEFSTARASSQSTQTRRETLYGLVRFNVADPLKIMVGGNVTHSKSVGFSYGSDTNFDNTRFLPFAGATLDFTPHLSAYVSYATIFNPQTQLDENDRFLDPIRGSNLEAGIKGDWFGGRLNAGIAAFRVRQDNTAEAARFGATIGNPTVQRTIFRGVDATSEGIEVEIGGRLAEGMQVTGGYTLMRLEDQNGDAARRFVPRNTARLNVVYSPPALPALKVGASGQYQSRITAPSGSATQGDYALLDLLARYDITPQLSLSANLRNVTNTKYLTAVNFDGGYYGAPRSILGTISVRY